MKTSSRKTQQRFTLIATDYKDHIPVLLVECIENLNIKKDGIYVDMTLGRAGHSREILRRLDSGHLYCFDQDIDAIDESKKVLRPISNNFTLIHANFKDAKEELEKLGVTRVDGILYDLGVSSVQFDQGDRGFSYRYDSRLDMRMDQSQKLTAYDIVNEYPLNDLFRVIRDYGEEKFAYNIARNIVRNRQTKKIETTFELVEIIKKSLPNKVLEKKGHPAKQTFQALRIEVNNELKVLEESIKKATTLLKPKGRLEVITFNSLEDKIVKYYFTSLTKQEGNRRLPTVEKELEFSLVNKKVIIASDNEVEINNRAKSAKLRILERN